MRPRTLDEVVGQEAILAPGKPLREAIERDLLQSIILWGPPGTGKTTLARVIAEITKAHFVPFSAQTRMSGCDLDGRTIRKGAVDSVAEWVTSQGGTVPGELGAVADRISSSGGTPLAVSDGPRMLGVVPSGTFGSRPRSRPTSACPWRRNESASKLRGPSSTSTLSGSRKIRPPEASGRAVAPAWLTLWRASSRVTRTAWWW